MCATAATAMAKPMIKPPVGPVSVSMPEFPPEKTGKPIMPAQIYMTTDNSAYGTGNVNPAINMNNVCKVKETTPISIETVAPKAMSTAKINDIITFLIFSIYYKYLCIIMLVNSGDDFMFAAL